MAICINSPLQQASLNTSNEGHGEKNDAHDTRFCYLNDEFVAGHIGLVPARLARSHSLQHVHAWSAVTVLSVDAIFEN